MLEYHSKDSLILKNIYYAILSQNFMILSHMSHIHHLFLSHNIINYYSINLIISQIHNLTIYITLILQILLYNNFN